MRNSTATSPGGVPAVTQAVDGGGDGLGLGHLVGVGLVADDGAGRLLGDQPDPGAGGAGEQVVGSGDHLRAGAVVADQVDRGGAGVLGGELAQVARVGAGEGVDRLGGIADHADLVAPAEPQVEQRGLEGRDVLELVDDEPFVLPPDLGRDALVVGEQSGGEQQDVLHVHAGLGALDLLIAAEAHVRPSRRRAR